MRRSAAGRMSVTRSSAGLPPAWSHHSQDQSVQVAAPPAAWAVRSGRARNQTGTAWCRPCLLRDAVVLTPVTRGLHAVSPEFDTCSIRARYIIIQSIHIINNGIRGKSIYCLSNISIMRAMNAARRTSPSGAWNACCSLVASSSWS